MYPRLRLAAALCASLLASSAHADASFRQHDLSAPHQRQNRPPVETANDNAARENPTQIGLTPKRVGEHTDKLSPLTKFSQFRSLSVAGDCHDISQYKSRSGAALADYLVSLPDVECTYDLFSISADDAAVIYSQANFLAVADRLAALSSSYAASGRSVSNLVLFLRAGYYDALGRNILPKPSDSVRDRIRIGLDRLFANPALFQPNPDASRTASEVLTLVTNLNDEAYYLPTMRGLVQKFTNTSVHPNAADGLKNYDASAGFTGVLTVMYLAHYRSEAANIVNSDPSYAQALYGFVVNNRNALLGSNYEYQLSDTLNEAFRFMQYPALLPTVKPMVKDMLAHSSMTGSDSGLWLASAKAVKYYDNANCSEYGTCNFEQQLADQVLPIHYTCSPTIKIRAQEMTSDQLKDSCDKLAVEENYFHTMLKTKKVPVANDNNTSLEVVVFDDYSNYDKYAGIIYDISTDNGGMYLEGDPSNPDNQARFIAHEASWLRPTFQIWNLEHEYVHYLDGRFDMEGDFSEGTSKPTVWWLEGLAEYLSHKNDYQEAIDAAKTGQYRLSQIFGNTYDMDDYVNRAYRWGYMAVRFMFEKHRADVDANVAKFRVGDYDSYWQAMQAVGTRYDDEFASWVAQAGTDGEPPLPGGGGLEGPDCASNNRLENGCVIRNLGSTYDAYVSLWVPRGAKNLKIESADGNGDANMYIGINFWPSNTRYHYRSENPGNAEVFEQAQPYGGYWYLITLHANQPFSGLSLKASFE